MVYCCVVFGQAVLLVVCIKVLPSDTSVESVYIYVLCCLCRCVHSCCSVWPLQIWPVLSDLRWELPGALTLFFPLAPEISGQQWSFVRSQEGPTPSNCRRPGRSPDWQAPASLLFWGFFEKQDGRQIWTQAWTHISLK